MKLPEDAFEGFRDKAAPDFDHLRRENAIPATPPRPNADPDDITTAARNYADAYTKPGTYGHANAMEEALSGNTAAVEGRVGDYPGHPFRGNQYKSGKG